MALRVLHIIPDLILGGAEKLVVNLITNIKYSALDVRLCLFYPPQSSRLLDELLHKGITIYHLNKRRGFDPIIIPQLYRVIRKFKPDIIHTHLYGFYYTMFPVMKNNVPVRIHTFHNIANNDCRKMETILRKMFFKRARFILVGVSKCVSKSVEKLYALPVHTIYNGTNPNEFYPVAKTPYQRVTTFVCTATFKHEKNHKFLINAFAKAISVKPYIKLWLVGYGPLLNKTKRYVQSKNLTDSVKFLGKQYDVSKILSKCDIFVLASSSEGFGLAIIEAMSASKPVISTNVGGISEIIDAGKTGILVSSTDVDEFANQMINLSENTELCTAIGKNARNAVINNYSLKRMVEEYISLYEKCYNVYS
jgi:glycosyltransferase involved in cell wall biosynthesis